MSLIEKFLIKNIEKKLKLAIVGDSIIDEYYYTKVKRISPEFPIPIILSENNEPHHTLPGGSLNLVYQFSDYNVEVDFIGLLNFYAESVLLINWNNKMNYSNSFKIPNIQVPIKRRLYDGDFPVSRWDLETYGYNLKDYLHTYLNRLKIPKSDITIFSDYNKGIFDIPWYKDYIKDNITIVDPKNDINKFVGCTIIKPNSLEAEKLTGCKNWKDQCKKIKDITNCQSVVITCAGEKVVGLDKEDFFEYFPKKKQNNVNNFSGAGDCFISIFSMCIGHNMSVPEASEVAYEAGAIYVQRKHNRPVSIMDLKQKTQSAKFATIDDLKNIEGTLVLNSGCFDFGLTRGHIESLKYAKQQGDYLVVAINDDNSIQRIKNRKPIMNLDDRMHIVASLEFVDFVISFSEDTPLNLYESILKNRKGDIICKGEDYKNKEVVGNHLTKVVLCPLYDCESTTDKINKL